MKPLDLTDQGNILNIKGMARSSHLKEKRISQRMAKECKKVLSSNGYKAEIQEIFDTSAVQEGAALAIHVETSSGSIIGLDRVGRPSRSRIHKKICSLQLYGRC